VKRSETAKRIADELAECGVKLVASLPDNWISELITHLEGDVRFTHVPVNREESAIGLCAGAYMGGMGSAALMGASGFMTCIYAITKINYSYVRRPSQASHLERPVPAAGAAGDRPALHRRVAGR